MIHQATAKIAEYFKSKEIKYTVQEVDTTSFVKVIFKTASISSFSVLLISTDENNDVALRVFDLVMVPPAKQQSVMNAINEVNNKFRYAKFVLNMKDSTVQMQMDIPMKTTDVGEIVMEMISRTLDIAEKAYPTLMQAVWG